MDFRSGKAEVALEIRNATKVFDDVEGQTVNALADVSLKIFSNEFVTLLGPSGCGKTTLLRCIAGLESLDSGDILIGGRSVADWPANRRPVHTVFQNYALFPHLCISKNVSYSLDIAGIKKKEINYRVAEMLSLVGLGGLGSRGVGELSGGQQQRVALARALIGRPEILLLDEPLSALDRALRVRMQEELKSLQMQLGISFVFVTHDQEEALIMSDRIAVLDGGRLRQFGTGEDLYKNPDNTFTALFLGGSNLFDAVVVENTGKEVLFSISDGQEIWLTVASVAGLEPGNAVQLLSRPEDVRIASDESESGLCFDGVVKAVHFAGAHYKLVIDAKLAFLLIMVTPKDTSRLADMKIGTSFRFVIPAGTLRVLANDQKVP